MTISFVGINSADTAGATTLAVSAAPGQAVGDLIIAVCAFEGVASGSGPWVTDDPTDVGTAQGWKRVCYQAPSATGVGLEVWSAIYSSGSGATFHFDTTRTCVISRGAWRGVYQPTGQITDGAVRDSATAQVTGNNPNAPSIFAFQNELVIACGAHTLNSPGFGTPTPAGWTKRIDVARASTFGNAESTIADMTAAANGTTGLIPWSATTTSSPKGATATLAIRPAPLPSGSGAAALSFRFRPY